MDSHVKPTDYILISDYNPNPARAAGLVNKVTYN